jgi:signal transduction histidine kinase
MCIEPDPNGPTRWSARPAAVPGREAAQALADLHRAERRFAVGVCGAFLAGGLCWVLLVDSLIYALTRDPVIVARFETAQGWTFVLLATALLYPLLRRSTSRLTRTQATLSAVIESIADGVLLLGRDRTIHYANAAAVRILRCSMASELVGMGADEFSRRFRVSYPDGAVVAPADFVSQRVFDEPGPLRYRAILHPGSGPQVIVSVTAAAVRGAEDEPAWRVVSVMHDITATEHLAEVRDQFFAAAAHGLKTPVTIIQASAQALLREAAAPDARLLSIERQCLRIDRLVGNLLLLARLRSGSLRLYPTKVALGPLVRDVARRMSLTARDHEVEVDLVSRPMVHGDPERLALALHNLIAGALEASRDGTQVTVRLVEHGRDAEIGIRYVALGDEESSREVHLADDLGVSRYVTQAVVRAHGGALAEEQVGNERATLVRLPALDAREHGV